MRAALTSGNRAWISCPTGIITKPLSNTRAAVEGLAGQTDERLLAQFEALVEEYDFHRIDATQSIREVFQSLTVEINQVLADMKPISPAEAERELSEALAESTGGRAK